MHSDLQIIQKQVVLLLISQMPSSTSLNERETSPLIGNEHHVSFAPLPLEESEEVLTPNVERSSLVNNTASPNEPNSPAIEPNSTTDTIEPTESTEPTTTTHASTINPERPNKKFLIHFHEHRLRFDQTYPEGLEERLPPEEYMSVLDRIHREMLVPLEVSQKRVNKWTRICFATAPIGVGFILSFWLGSYVHKNQRLLKTFWRTFKSHLKKINKDSYLARGIEWRIERDYSKVAEREAYNRWHNFRIEVIFRKPVKLRSSEERSQVGIPNSGVEEQRAPVQSAFTDPEFLAAAAIAGTHHESFLDALSGFENHSESQQFDALEEEAVDTELAEEEEKTDYIYDIEDTEEVDNISESSVESIQEAMEEAEIQETKFGKDFEEAVKRTESLEVKEIDQVTEPVSFAAAVAIPLATVQYSASLASSPPVTRINSPTRKKTYAEMIEAVKALSVDEEEPTTNLSVIPEASEILSDNEISENLEVNDAVSFSSFAVRQQKKMERLSGVKPSGQLAAFSLVDPFAALYETDAVSPLYPPSPRSEADETAEVDGEFEDLRRKKYRVAPERASRLSKVYTMTETIQPASRRASYVPVNSSLRKTMLG